MTRRAGFTAISMVISLVIILVLIWIFFSYGTRSLGGRAQVGPPQQVIGQAKDLVCRDNLRQIRQALQLAQMGEAEDHFPASLDNLGLSQEQLKCPVSGEAYAYDPASGRVSCNYPRHKGY